jgi:diguanylate cyclase (GGDEF)-like protein
VRLITRNDASLAIGLIVGAFVAFQQPLRFILDAARDVEVRYRIDLLPALTVVAGVFIFHQYRKRLLSKSEAATASAEAALARARSEELERLMMFSQDLVRVLDVAMLQQVLWKNLPSFTRGRGFWVVARGGGRWHEVLQDATRTHQRPFDRLEAMADVAFSQGANSAASTAGISNGDSVCFPLFAGEEAVGVLGIDDGDALASDDRKAIGTAAALIAAALRNVQLFEETRQHSIRDRLTGCFNHEQCLHTVDSELKRARRSGRPLSIVMFDIDHFKTVNDELGHLRGDEILRAVGAQLNRKLRSTDFSGRYGGDEFLIVLPDTDLAGAERVAEILRQEISTLVIASAGSRPLAVTASIGVAAAVPGELDVSALIKRTDEALYRSKTAGRNRVSVAIAPAAAPLAPESEAVPEPAAAGRETLLVVEDEPLMQDFIRSCLAPLGYTILPTSNAADALAIGDARSEPIDLLLADVVLPDLLGPELAARMRRIRPNIKVVFMSGFVDHPAMLTSIDPDSAFLQKPFTARALAAKIRGTLDAPPAAVRAD